MKKFMVVDAALQIVTLEVAPVQFYAMHSETAVGMSPLTVAI